MLLQICRSIQSYSKKEISNILHQVTKDKFTIKYSRSSGPGGQNVNKLNTKVELRLNIHQSEWLPKDLQEKLYEDYSNSINKNGEIILTSEKTRSQQRNLSDAIEKCRKLINDALFVPEGPSEETLLKIEDRKVKANEKRLIEKKFMSIKKRDRKNID